MAAPGYSINDILTAIHKAKVLWDSFNADFDSAENRITELHETFEFLSSAYNDYAALLEQCNRTHPGQASLLRKLRELESFLRKYSELAPGQNPSDRVAKARRAWQIAKFSFDDHVEKLNHGLKMEMQKLALSMAQLSLQTNNPPAITNNNTFHLHADTSAEPIVDHFISQLWRARNRYEREMSEAAVQRRLANPQPIERDVERAIRQLCNGFGLSDPYIPILTGRDLLQSSQRSWNGLMINMFHDSLHGPLRPALFDDERTIPQLRSSASPNLMPPLDFTSTVSTGGAPSLFSVSTGDHSIMTTSTAATTPEIVGRPYPNQLTNMPPLGAPALKADISFGRNKLSLQDWYFSPSSVARSSARLEWTADGESRTIEHYIPQHILPYTKHKILEEPQSVEFLGLYRVIYKVAGTIKRDIKIRSKYTFSEPDDFIRFQCDARDRDIVGLYDFDAIKSKSTTLSAHEVLTLWAPRHPHQSYSLSFFGNKDQRHIELGVQQVQTRPVISRKDQDTSIQLELIASPSRRGSSIMRRKSSAPDASASTTRSTGNRASVSSVGSANITTQNATQVTQEWVDKHQYLKIRFSSHSDYKSFASAFADAQKAAARVSASLEYGPFELGYNPFRAELPTRSNVAELAGSPPNPRSRGPHAPGAG